MDLKTARFITNKNQLDIEQNTGVSQVRISKFEKRRIGNFNREERKQIEKYLRVKIDWNSKEGQSEPLTKDEQEEIRPFIAQIMANKGERKFLEWASSFETNRDFYNGLMDILNSTLTSAFMRIHIPVREMKWERRR